MANNQTKTKNMSCNEQFFHKEQLGHDESHRGEKCFKCDVCPYACAALRHLQSHALNHTNEKPFKCSECNACFRQKQLLRRHQNLYHNPTYVPRPPKAKDHECRDCGRRFAHQGNLLRHLHVHDPASSHREDALALRRTRRRRAQIDEAHGPNERHEASDADQDEMKKDVAQTVDIVTVIAEDGERIFDMQVAQSEDGDSLASATYTDDSVDYLEDDSGNENADTRKAAGSPLDAQSGSGGEAENDVESCFGFDISTGS